MLIIRTLRGAWIETICLAAARSTAISIRTLNTAHEDNYLIYFVYLNIILSNLIYIAD